jgi:hypothetical protein
VAPVERGALCWELASLLRRSGQRGAATDLWRRLTGEGGPWAVPALVELAKHHEHHERDYGAATRAVEAALVALARSATPDAETQRVALERRLGRLHFKRALGSRPEELVALPQLARP